MPDTNVVEDSKKLNKRGLTTFWECIVAYFRPITNAEIDEITGVTIVDADDIQY